MKKHNPVTRIFFLFTDNKKKNCRKLVLEPRQFQFPRLGVLSSSNLVKVSMSSW